MPLLPEPCYRFFTDICRRLVSVNYCILRNYENLPYELDNDLDVLVSPAARREVQTICVEAAKAAGLTKFDISYHVPLVMVFYDPSRRFSFKVDIFTEISWHGFPLLDPKVVLENRVPYGTFWVANPADEAFINLMTGLTYQGHVKPKYRALIKRSLDSGLADRLETLLGARLKTAVTELIAREDWNNLPKYRNACILKVITRTFATAPVLALGVVPGYTLRAAKRILAKQGLILR